MLAKGSLVTSADDYRAAVRRGARFASPHTVTYVRRPTDDSIRFGFIVSKAVGIAVRRNVVRRRLKAICFEALTALPGDVHSDVVIRALPGADQIPFSELHAEVTRSLVRAKILVEPAAGP